jgi:hypothetical protein
MNLLGAAGPISTTDELRRLLVGLKMARALEALDDVLRRLEEGSLSALEAIHLLLAGSSRPERPAVSRPA